MKPYAWGCKTCNKIDWADTEEPLAKPEHRPYRGMDLGTCDGEMIPLVREEDVKEIVEKEIDESW